MLRITDLKVANILPMILRSTMRTTCVLREKDEFSFIYQWIFDRAVPICIPSTKQYWEHFNPSRLERLLHYDPHKSFVDKGDAKVMLSAVMSISIFRDDMIFGALAIGRR